ncbi:hypothetical protein ACFQH5_20235 [Halomonas salifodinae]|uniref:Uncharacterized protein n=1 Tax=Halomonas salifodinae TaxID=438745 RepID=A0ABW2F0W5_9GAMM
MIHPFSEIDKTQAWFKKLHDSLEAKLAKLREKNDADRGPVDTAHLRGQIAVLRELLNDMSDKPTPQAPARRNPYQ